MNWEEIKLYWINVSDNLPENKQKVLVYGRWKGLHMDVYSAVYFKEDEYNKPSFMKFGEEVKDVSHWMDYPAIPGACKKCKAFPAKKGGCINHEDCPFKELKTSEEWEEELAEGWIIMDPDGWDRKNFDYSFKEERITKEEFYKRLSLSTVLINSNGGYLGR
jgi:hypothetical protein